MKKCESCGRYISDFDRICPHCGQADKSMPEEEKPAENPAENPQRPTISLEKPAADDKERETERTNPGDTAFPFGQNRSAYNGAPRADLNSPYPMKWHRFLMVVMIIGAILTIISAVGFLSGNVYLREGLQPDKVYEVYPGMKNIDRIYGIAMIAVGAFQIIVRNQLNAFRKSGPKFLMILYVAAIVANLIYYLGVVSALKDHVGETAIAELRTSNLTQMIALVIYAVINYVYYKKRKSLFVY